MNIGLRLLVIVGIAWAIYSYAIAGAFIALVLMLATAPGLICALLLKPAKLEQLGEDA